MTKEEIKTARAFVACGRWVWLPGMLCVKPVGLPGGPHGGMGYQPSASVRVTKVTLYPAKLSMGAYDWSPVGCLPDVTDPATLGCIVRLIQDAGGLIAHLSVLPLGARLVVEWPDGRIDSFRGTFAGVLLQALQAAPEVTDGT